MPAIIFVTFFWIIWDVGFSIWSAVVSGPLTTKEWIWLGSGLAFAVFALLAEWREWKARDRAEKAHNEETAALNIKLTQLQSYNEGAFTALGNAGARWLKRARLGHNRSAEKARTSGRGKQGQG
jgi:hypothetical protein